MNRTDGQPRAKPLPAPRAYVYNYSRVGGVSHERIPPEIREKLRAIHDTSNELLAAIFQYEGVPVMSTMKLPARARYTQTKEFEWDDFLEHNSLHPSEEMWSVFHTLKHPQRRATHARDRTGGEFLRPGDPDEMIAAMWAHRDRFKPERPHKGETVADFLSRGGTIKVLPSHPVNLGENPVMAYGIIGEHAHNHPWRHYIKPPDKAGPLEPPKPTDSTF